jgi:hypothetical protein
MLEKVFLPHQLEKLKSDDKRLPDFTNHREQAPEIPDSDGEEETLDDPMEIDFVKKKELISLATIECKVKRLKIPAMVLDSGAELPIVSEDIVKRVGWKIDKSVKYDLSGVATVPIVSIGVARNFLITFPPGFTIPEDFVVVRALKLTLIFRIYFSRNINVSWIEVMIKWRFTIMIKSLLFQSLCTRSKTSLK